MEVHKNFCQPLRDKNLCLSSAHLHFPSRRVISFARNSGLAESAGKLEELRRVLRAYKESPCHTCVNSEGGALPSVANFILQTPDSLAKEVKAASAHAALTGVELFGGFVYSGPRGKRTAAFNPITALKFAWVRLTGMFGGKTTVALSGSILKHANAAAEAVTTELGKVQTAIGAPDKPGNLKENPE